MENYELIKKLSKTSVFCKEEIEQLMNQLENNLQNKPKHLDIRKKISQRQIFADAQADCTAS